MLFIFIEYLNTENEVFLSVHDLPKIPSSQIINSTNVKLSSSVIDTNDNPILLIDNEASTTLTVNQEVLKKHFPIFINEDMNKFQMSNRSEYSTAYLYDGQKTAFIILRCLQTMFPLQTFFSILDANANVGGNTSWFGKYFDAVTAVELDTGDCDRLQNNIKNVYNMSHVNVVCGDALAELDKQNVYWDCIFFDPPWGGRNYDKFSSIYLALNQIDINIIINWCLLSNKTKFIVLKHPENTFLNSPYLVKTFTFNRKKKVKSITKSINKYETKVFYQLSFFTTEKFKEEAIKQIPNELYMLF